MKIDLSSFKKALASLEKALVRSKGVPEDEEIRDAVIHRFECTYELSWKMLKRQLEQELPTPSDADRLSFKDLIREGAERGLIDNAEAWFLYRRQRNITSHVYDKSKADSVWNTAFEFIEDARRLLRALEERGG